MAPNAARYRSLISRMPDHGHAQCGEARHLGPLLRQRRQEAGQGEDRTPARQGLDPSKVQPSRSPEQASRAKRRPGDGSAEVKIQDSQDCPACAFCHRLFPTLDAVAVSHIYSPHSKTRKSWCEMMGKSSVMVSRHPMALARVPHHRPQGPAVLGARKSTATHAPEKNRSTDGLPVRFRVPEESGYICNLPDLAGRRSSRLEKPAWPPSPNHARTRAAIRRR